MRLDFVRMFVDSTQATFREVIDPVAEVDAIQMRPSPDTGGEVMVIVALAGEAEGRVIFNMDLYTARQLVTRMLEEEQAELNFPELNSFARSAIAELASIATGKALSEINDAGNFLKMAPPIVISGSNLQSHDHGLETLVVPIHTTYGEVRLNVSVQDLR